MKIIAFLLSSLIVISLLLSGCGDDQPTTTKKSDQEQVKPKTQDELKQDYVDQLNNIGLKDRLQLISQYGLVVKDFDPTNENEVKELKDTDQTGIPKYKELSNYLQKMQVPNDYKEFHNLLMNSISEFVGTMEEMDLHLKNVNETDHLTKATAHYMVSTEAMIKLAKKLPFGELK